jgi:hypothetical protein
MVTHSERTERDHVVGPGSRDSRPSIDFFVAMPLVKGDVLVTNTSFKMPVVQFRAAGPMTLNNPTAEEIDFVRRAWEREEHVTYVTFCHEVGESGTPHLQIFSYADTKFSRARWHKALGSRVANIEPTQNLERTIQYCQGFEFNDQTQEYQRKAGSGSFEQFGTPPGTGQGARNDLKAIKERIDGGEKVLDMLRNDSDMIGTYVHSYKALERYQTHVRDQTARELASEQHMKYVATRQKVQWEQMLDDVLSGDPHPRKIYWLVDTLGDAGKTVYAKTLGLQGKAFVITGGKAADIYYAYGLQRIVILNICASQDKESAHYLYKVLEEFKDGHFLSTKYDSREVYFPIPHVIVFSNEWPDKDRLKKDRLEVIDILRHSNPV